MRGSWRPFHEHIYAAVFQHENQALRLIEYVIEKDFLMDRITLLGKRLSKGDDLLGLYYPSPKERMKTWAKWGVIGGAIWGLFAGIVSAVSNPDSTGAIKIDSLLKASFGAVIYGSVVGGAMAAAAGFSQVAAELHRMGVPKEQLAQLEEAVKADKYLILLYGSRIELEPFRNRIEYSGAELFLDFPMDRFEV